MTTSLFQHQAIRFIIIGATAASVHFITVVLISELSGMLPLIANIFGFLIAFCVSYCGQQFWTFNHSKPSHGALIKFFLTAVFSFILNEGLFALLLKLTSINYILSLFIVLLTVPPLTFIMSKYWAFKK